MLCEASLKSCITDMDSLREYEQRGNAVDRLKRDRERDMCRNAE